MQYWIRDGWPSHCDIGRKNRNVCGHWDMFGLIDSHWLLWRMKVLAWKLKAIIWSRLCPNNHHTLHPLHCQLCCAHSVLYNTQHKHKGLHTSHILCRNLLVGWSPGWWRDSQSDRMTEEEQDPVPVLSDPPYRALFGVWLKWMKQRSCTAAWLQVPC